MEIENLLEIPNEKILFETKRLSNKILPYDHILELANFNLT